MNRFIYAFADTIMRIFRCRRGKKQKQTDGSPSDRLNDDSEPVAGFSTGPLPEALPDEIPPHDRKREVALCLYYYQGGCTYERSGTGMTSDLCFCNGCPTPSFPCPYKKYTPRSW